jgi:energy-coupling factor transport system permease protein
LRAWDLISALLKRTAERSAAAAENAREEIDKISKAQRARGADFRSGGLSQRIRGLVPVFIPIFVSAFRRAEDLAIAMEARGFRGAPRRTRLYRLRLGRGDLVAFLVVLAVILAALGLERSL